ncbi:MAG: GH3 auxin-responsive promoter family protein [Lachnospiraceae bacterium]|nr:GH3 auxin-responsive promoter family protein [Lachnospiraceae bacterium]
MSKETYMANHMNVEMGKKALAEFREDTKDPMKVTSDLLLGLLEDNKDTEYGKKYDFAGIKTIEDYQKKVPVITYDDIAVELERMMAGERNILTAYPYDHMNETSGTVGVPKVVPMTEKQSDVFVKYNFNVGFGVMGETLTGDWEEGRAFCTSSGNCRTLDSGITVGEASAKMADFLKGGVDELDRMIRTMYTSPVEGLNPVPGSDAKYIHTRFAMMDRDVRGIVTGFYSVAVLYLQYIADNYEMIIDDIEKGTINADLDLSNEVRASLMKKIEPMPERARELREAFRDGADEPFIRKLWPKFTYITGAGGDGFQVYDKLIRERYVGDDDYVNFYSGITASEGLWSAITEANNTTSVIVPGSAFVEFLPVEAGDDFTQCKTLDHVEEGKIYELIITNLSGFYRYRMSDAVKIMGFYNKTPKVEFMYRVNRTINLAEEKTTEKALQVTVENAMQEFGIQIYDFSVYPDTSVTPNNYIFLIDPIREHPEVDMDALRECIFKHLIEANPVYYECYEDKWLGKPEVYFLQPQTSLLYRDMMVMRGASLNQLKPVRVIMNERQRKFFFGLRQD